MSKNVLSATMIEITAIEKEVATGRRHWREVRSVSVCVYKSNPSHAILMQRLRQWQACYLPSLVAYQRAVSLQRHYIVKG
jgi:hypothetical protein